MTNTLSDLRFDVLQLSANEKLVLDHIWRYGPISRKALADLTGLTGASTSRLTRHALSIGLIEESVAYSGSVGSPSRPLQRTSDGAYSVGVSFAKNLIECAVSDLSGNLGEVHQREVENVTIDDIAGLVLDTVSTDPQTKDNALIVLGVGLAVPGYRSTHDGEWAAHWDFPDLLGVDLATEVAKKTNLPVFAERDSIACLWSEHLNGAFRTVSNLCLLYLAQGVGGAVMSDGQLVLGQNGNAGGLGALFPYGERRPSAADLSEFLKLDADQFFSTTAILSAPADKIDRWVELVQPSLRYALTVIARLYDPATVVMSGSLPTTVLRQLIDSVSDLDLPEQYTAALPTPELAVTQSPDTGRLLSAAATLPFASIVSRPRVAVP